MSNFICPHCQQVIDDGSDGFTSDREIELEKDIERLSDRNAKLEKKLYIAVQALEEYADTVNWSDCILRMPEFDLEKEVKESCYTYEGYKDAQEALAKISEVKK